MTASSKKAAIRAAFRANWKRTIKQIRQYQDLGAFSSIKFTLDRACSENCSKSEHSDDVSISQRRKKGTV